MNSPLQVSHQHLTRSISLCHFSHSYLIPIVLISIIEFNLCWGFYVGLRQRTHHHQIKTKRERGRLGDCAAYQVEKIKANSTKANGKLEKMYALIKWMMKGIT